MKNLKEKINPTQKWDGQVLHFDPDSSPEAWRHFKKYYNVDNWRELINYNFTSLHHYTFEGGMYKDTPKEKNNSLFALENGMFLGNKNNTDYYKPCKRLRGETDLNFSYKHFPYFEKKINSETNDKEKGLALLDECKQMHHTLLNFSLMQSHGRMQGFKGKGLILENGTNECRDRLDTLVFKLDEYYKNDKNKRETDIIEYATDPNKDSLVEYLNTFDGIYDYCKKVYFIEDGNFVDRIICEGQKPIKLGEDVIQYMTLALDFWDEKQKYFNSVSK